MKKKYETRYFVTDVASIPVVRVYGKTEMYKQAAKDGWGVVYRDEENVLVCDEDCSADFYTKNGGYYGLSGNDEVNTKEMPKQAACAAIITSDSCGFSFWAEDFNQIHIFVTYDENGLIDTYRVEYGDSPIYDGEVEITFEDLYERAEEDWRETYRAELPGTVEYQFKQEADKLAQEAGETWMDGEQREQFRQVCDKIDRIKSAWEFKATMQLLGYDYDKKIINAARKFKKCHTAAQYETERETAARVEQEAREAAADQPAAPAGDGQKTGISLVYMDDLGVARCGDCGAELLCNGAGDMPDNCPECGRRLEYDSFIEPEGPDADRYREDNQQDAGTAAEAASKGQKTALGTPETMAGTDTSAAADGQQATPWAREINLGKLETGTRPETGEREPGKQPGGP